MQDIDEIITALKDTRLLEEPDAVLLNRISALPSSKRRLKRSIVERIRLLVTAYMSLATFVPDELVDQLNKNPTSKRTGSVYQKILKDMDHLKQEVLQQICPKQ